MQEQKEVVSENQEFQPSEHDKQIYEEIQKSQPGQIQQTDVRKRMNSTTVQAILNDKDSKIKAEDLPTFAPGYKPPRQISVQQIISQDQEDDSLKNYKQTLLGDIDEEEINEGAAPEVEIIQIEIVCQDRPAGNIILDFGPTKEVQKAQYQLKEDAVFNLRVHFKVRYDIVNGLKFVNNVWRGFLKVDKYEEMMGSFAPKKDIQVYDFQLEQAPSGFLERGTYKGRSMFVDNDGIVHMQYDYECKIGKNWDSE